MTKRQVIKISGDFGGQGLPQLNVTDEEITIASLPNLVCWFDPQIRWIRESLPVGLHDRVDGYALKEFSANEPVITFDINGQPVAQMTSANASGYSVEGLSLHPAGSYTKMVVCQFDSIRNQDIISADGNICRLRLDGSGYLWVVQGSDNCRTSEPVIAENTPYLIQVFYNDETSKIKILVNGVNAPMDSDTASVPAVSSDLSFGLARTIGSFFDGKMGYGLVFGADYSAPAYSKSLAEITSILATRYALPIS